MKNHISWVEVEEKVLEGKILAEYSGSEVRKHLEYLTTLIRRAGTEDELKAAKYIKSKLDEYGIDAKIYEIDAYISHPGKADIEVLSPVQKSFSGLPRTFIPSTPPEGIEAEVIYLGKSLAEDYQGVDARGKIVLGEPAYREGRLELAMIAQEKGAIAQIHITPGTSRSINIGQLRFTWGNPTPETIDKIPQIPVIAICYEDGTYLRELIKKGPLSVRLKADAWRGYRTIRLPIGVLEGMKEPDKYVILGGHYCSWFTGATDNAVSNSLMLEMARIFSKHRKSIDRGIRFAWWAGHEQGTYAGSTWYLDHFWDDIRDHAIAYLVMDGLGRAGSSRLEVSNTEEIRKFSEGISKEVLDLEVESKRVVKVGDQSFWGMGIPSISISSGFTGDRTSAIWYSHTAEDTLDKVDTDLIKMPFKAYTVSILRLCNSRVLPFEFVTMAELFKKGLEDLQKGVKPILELTSLIHQVETLKKKAEALNLSIKKNISSFEKKRRSRDFKNKFKEINSCFMELSRILIPTLSSKAGKYGQDPMGMKFAPMPTLQPLHKLNAMDSQSEKYRALQTSLLREKNKVSDALNLANRILDDALKKI